MCLRCQDKLVRAFLVVTALDSPGPSDNGSCKERANSSQAGRVQSFSHVSCSRRILDFTPTPDTPVLRYYSDSIITDHTADDIDHKPSGARSRPALLALHFSASRFKERAVVSDLQGSALSVRHGRSLVSLTRSPPHLPQKASHLLPLRHAPTTTLQRFWSPSHSLPQLSLHHIHLAKRVHRHCPP